MTTLVEMLQHNRSAILQQAVANVQKQIPLYSQLPPQAVLERLGVAFDALTQELNGSPDNYSTYLRNLSYSRAGEGVPLKYVQQAIQTGVETMIAYIRHHDKRDDPDLIDAIDQLHSLSNKGIIGLFQGYEEAQQETITAQKMALEELSTPIIPIFKGILVLPIVGSIDSNRAGQIMEALLNQIGETSADIVILDITGVPVIDTSVANYLLHAARAARLLGSNVVLVGIGPEIAQTIVQLGIDLTGITTRANLQSGIEYALDTKGLAIRPK